MINKKTLEGKLVSYSRYLSDNIDEKLSIITNYGIIIRHPSKDRAYKLSKDRQLRCDVLWNDGIITEGVNVRSLKIM